MVKWTDDHIVFVAGVPFMLYLFCVSDKKCIYCANFTYVKIELEFPS